MTGTTLSDGRQQRDRGTVIADLLPFSLGGFALGVVAIFATALFDAAVLATAQYFAGSGATSESWPQWAVALFGLMSVLVSLVGGYWLFSLRRWIGLRSDPDDQLSVDRKRRHFIVGSMIAYAPLTPVVWLLMVALANST